MNTWPGWQLALLAWGWALLLIRRRSAGTRRLRPRARPKPARPRVHPARLARPAALLAGAALFATSHPVAGLLAGAALWWVLPAVVARLQTQEEAAQRQALAEQLPLAAGLLSACLTAGAPPAEALAITADAMPDPAGAVLRRAARTVALGGGPGELAEVLAAPGEDGWRSIGAAVVRSSITGAPLADLLHDHADAALQSWAAAAAVRARSVAVRSVLPLALCYLPAFLVLGVAPLVAGLLAGVELP